MLLRSIDNIVLNFRGQLDEVSGKAAYADHEIPVLFRLLLCLD
jgi:hypothetical protein